MTFSEKIHRGLKAPFPWFGGKSRVAHLVWERFGDVPNYVEPFAGSLATLLKRPTPPRVETVNDLDCYLANFWRALRADPSAVAGHAAWPVNEADLHARHRWLHAQADFRSKMRRDPEFFDARIAGWWVWGLSCWIGDNWCRPWERTAPSDLQGHGKGVNKVTRGDGSGLDARRPALGSRSGVHQLPDQIPALNGGGGGYPGYGKGVHQQIPHLRHEGQGVHQNVKHRNIGIHEKRPSIGGTPGRKNGGARGILTADRCAHKTQLSGNGHGVGVHSGDGELLAWFEALADRLRRVRCCCGDWQRVLKPSVTTNHGITAVFLDPPYGVEDRDKVYNHDSVDVAGDVRAWCREHGSDPLLRIALCGYEGEHNALEAHGWAQIAWKAAGGYGNQGTGNENAKRERIWFSPHCLRVGLFD